MSRHCPSPKIVNGAERLVAAEVDDLGSFFVGQSTDHPHAEPHSELIFYVCRFKRAIPARGIDADRLDFNAMVAGIAGDLRRSVKPHGLRIQQRSARDFRVPAFQP